jgi:hypothetical protein
MLQGNEFGAKPSGLGTGLFTQKEVASVASVGRSIPIGVMYCYIRGTAIQS